uniref:Ulp1 protease-like protein n=2 Tax=Oryza sativa subsp. japonica TaxID=39947 RepID=Q6ESB1_ORYSJ|nr:Ulp1 protease-like protein [Oryza sativa Japonica Group]
MSSDEIGTIIVIDNLVYRDHPSLKIRGVPKDVRSYDVEGVRNKEQLSTRVGCRRVHSIIENILDKCGVIAHNLPTKTDDLSHSTSHGWTTREKVVNGQFLANAVGLITRHDCERTSGYATSWQLSYYLYFNKVDSRPPRNLRELRLGTPRADKALSDPVETKDHVKGPRAFSSENDSLMTRLGARESENSIRHYGRLHVSMVLYQDRLRRVRQMLTRLRRRLYAFSIVRERKTEDLVVRYVLPWLTSDIDSDKPFRCPHEADKGSLNVISELTENGHMSSITVTPGSAVENINTFICIEVGGYCQGYGYHIPNSSRLHLGRTHHIPCPIQKQPTDMEGVPDKERQPEFYMETTRTTRIVSILVSLVLLGQGDTYRDRHGYSPTVSPDTVRRDESAISDLARHVFEEEGYLVVNYKSDHGAMEPADSQDGAVIKEARARDKKKRGDRKKLEKKKWMDYNTREASRQRLNQ